MSFLRHDEIYPCDEGVTTPGHALAHRTDEFRAGYSLAGCAPAVKYQTSGLDKTVRNKARVNWREAIRRRQAKGRRLTGAFASPSRSVVLGPVIKSVMTPSLGGLPRARRSRLGEYSFCTARAAAFGLLHEETVSWRGDKRVLKIFL